MRKHDRLWSIILAGGEGQRIRPLVERWLGLHKPKQYCTFVGTRSMLEHTLDRADRLAPPQRKVIVIARSHQRPGWVQVGGTASGTVIVQPANCDTGAGIFLPLTYVRVRDPGATVAIYPSDHFVYPEHRFAECLRSAVCAAEELGDRLVLLGATPDRPEPDFGWILPRTDLGEFNGRRVREVEGFSEKPRAAEATTAMASGALWNTLVLASKVETLWKLGWRCFPEMMGLFETLSSAIEAAEEEAVMESVYREMPVRNFSSDLLARAIDQVAVIELSAVLWNDWGRPERIVDTLRQIGKQPSFPLEHLVVC